MTDATPTPFHNLISQPLLLQNLTEKMGFTAPTPIQETVAPIILRGANLFAGAKTGSGKTIAFLAPLAQRIFANELQMALVLSPTRELALQIDEEAARLLEGQTEVVSVPLYGGVPTDPQILAMKHHRPRILIATPGRFLDLVQDDCIPLSRIEACVLDEADRMCDMGFAPQVGQILDLLSARKQTLLFSATLPKELNDIMQRFCPDPERVQIDAADESSATITHDAIVCARRDKPDHLVAIVSNPDVHAIIFVKTRNRADEIYRGLSGEMEGVGILHAGFEMNERERTMRAFREGKIRLLIATDVASRGIDIEKVTHVIHYDLPDALEDYIHRSGRSGRAGRTGSTFAFVERDNHDQMERFREFGKKIQFKTSGPMEEASNDASASRENISRDSSRGPRSRNSSQRRGGSRGSSGGRSHSSGDRQSQSSDRPSHAGDRAQESHPRSRSRSANPSRSQSRGPSSRGPSSGTSRGPRQGARRSERAPSHSHSERAPAKSGGGILSKTKSLFKKVFSKKKR